MAEMASCPEMPCARKRCNIVILGRTGSGKSTLANKILCHPCFDVDSKRIFKSVTGTEIQVQSEERAIMLRDNVVYSVKVVDTKGFLEPQTKPGNILTNIKLCFQERFVEGVSLVLFVLPKGRLSAGEIETIKTIHENFHDLSCMSALVVTRCDGLKKEIRDGIEQEFRTSERTSAIADFMKKGILTVGFPDLSLMPEMFRPILEEVIRADVQKLHDLMCESTTMHLTSEMFFQDQFWDKIQETKLIDTASQSGYVCSVM